MAFVMFQNEAVTRSSYVLKEAVEVAQYLLAEISEDERWEKTLYSL